MELSPGRDTVTGGAGTTLVSIQPNIAANQTRAFAVEATDTGHSIGDLAWEQPPIAPTIEASRLGVFVLLLDLARTDAGLARARWALLIFALSPVSVMVTGFHGNTDPVMVLFLVAAAHGVIKQRPVWCGLLFALSCQVKVAPLLL